MNRELETHIGKLNLEYKHHQDTVTAKIEKCEGANIQSQKLKQQMVIDRGQKQQAMNEVAHQSEIYQDRFSEVNEVKHSLRLQLSEIEKVLRDVQREIATTNLENSSLKTLISGEKELRDERKTEETDAVQLVIDDLVT